MFSLRLARDTNPRRKRRGHEKARKFSSLNITPSLVSLQRLKGSSLQYWSIVGSDDTHQ
jgi:hypothetical protein